MGRTWSLGPAPPAPGQSLPPYTPALSADFEHLSFTLKGEDIYRLVCRGCHQEAGQGAPPEIKSLINPVRATSVQLIMDRMKERGMDMSTSDAAVLAKQANESVIHRLHEGGKNMPPFHQLTEAEIRSLFPYLKVLAGVPGAEKGQVPVMESTSFHIGELIVKSTCHSCHDAVGRNPTPEEIFNGAIPPLSSLTKRTSLLEFTRKVVQGAPILMGSPPELYRGKMSVFYYLTPDEAASAYMYLLFYPPQE